MVVDLAFLAIEGKVLARMVADEAQHALAQPKPLRMKICHRKEARSGQIIEPGRHFRDRLVQPICLEIACSEHRKSLNNELFMKKHSVVAIHSGCPTLLFSNRSIPAVQHQNWLSLSIL